MRSRYLILAVSGLSASVILFVMLQRVRMPPQSGQTPPTEHEMMRDTAAGDGQGVAAEPPVLPDGRSAALLEASPVARNVQLAQAIRVAGYRCQGTPTAHPVASGGSQWRVNCGGTLIYVVSVDERGGLRAAPMPYGDIDPSTGAPIIIEGERTLELPER